MCNITDECSGQCDVGWVNIENGCFTFDQSVSFNWTEAVNYCQQLDSNLAPISTANTLSGAIDYINEYS